MILNHLTELSFLQNKILHIYQYASYVLEPQPPKPIAVPSILFTHILMGNFLGLPGCRFHFPAIKLPLALGYNFVIFITCKTLGCFLLNMKLTIFQEFSGCVMKNSKFKNFQDLKNGLIKSQVLSRTIPSLCVHCQFQRFTWATFLM